MAFFIISVQCCLNVFQLESLISCPIQ